MRKNKGIVLVLILLMAVYCASYVAFRYSRSGKNEFSRHVSLDHA